MLGLGRVREERAHVAVAQEELAVDTVAADGRLLATGEHMLIHVSLETRRASDPAPEIAQKLDRIEQAHAKRGLPGGVGRAVGKK